MSAVCLTERFPGAGAPQGRTFASFFPSDHDELLFLQEAAR